MAFSSPMALSPPAYPFGAGATSVPEMYPLAVGASSLMGVYTNYQPAYPVASNVNLAEVPSSGVTAVPNITVDLINTWAVATHINLVTVETMPVTVICEMPVDKTPTSSFASRVNPSDAVVIDLATVPAFDPNSILAPPKTTGYPT